MRPVPFNVKCLKSLDTWLKFSDKSVQCNFLLKINLSFINKYSGWTNLLVHLVLVLQIHRLSSIKTVLHTLFSLYHEDYVHKN